MPSICDLYLGNAINHLRVDPGTNRWHLVRLCILRRFVGSTLRGTHTTVKGRDWLQVWSPSQSPNASPTHGKACSMGVLRCGYVYNFLHMGCLKILKHVQCLYKCINLRNYLKKTNIGWPDRTSSPPEAGFQGIVLSTMFLGSFVELDNCRLLVSNSFNAFLIIQSNPNASKLKFKIVFAKCRETTQPIHCTQNANNLHFAQCPQESLINT